MRTRMGWLLAVVAAGLFVGCDDDGGRDSDRVLRLATTTSTRDSGLLDVLLPPFERAEACRVDVVAVGTGAALRLGASGDADAVLVHARAAEEAFVAAGHARRHEEFMTNGFLILGPANDPAGIRGLAPDAAMRRLAEAEATFVSRGDDSGTHKRELALRAQAGVDVWPGLVESGQGMGASLLMADEMRAYVLCDSGTWANMANRSSLEVMVVKHPSLANPYAIMPVSRDRHDGVHEDLANRLADYLISAAAQTLIRDYEVGGQRLFEPTRLGVKTA
ncbi:MAG: substrate-binding domain-containing protein, partial [Planctomycetes bacterium]|nr:substrate-binding domain-containing protein [Planctomycetota bacterium]